MRNPIHGWHRVGLGLGSLVVAGLAPLAAQVPTASERGVTVGAEWRQFKVGADSIATTIRQVMVPVGLTWQKGSVALDFGSGWVQSRVSQGGAGRSVSGLTDTQVRASYTFGADRLVASVVANLPTGLSKAPIEDFPILGAISSSFFSFPAASHGAGFFTTGGLALAVPAGAWNLGIAGSVRWSGRYTPYVDASGPLSYQPGIEGRIRAGADRTVGRSRVTGGVTYSTFGTDEFGTGTTTTGLYKPGNRWTLEAGVLAPVGPRSTISVYGWHYRRVDGDSSTVAVANRERITAGGISFLTNLSPGFELQLGADGRLARLGEAPGRLVGAEVGLGITLSRRLSLLPAIRFDTGSLDPVVGRLPVRGMGASVFIRSR